MWTGKDTGWTEGHRRQREHDRLESETTNKERNPYQRDRDRIVHSSAFRRLGGVGQIASVDHVEPFHNRLIHTVKVAQIGRRLAEYILAKTSTENQRVLDNRKRFPRPLIQAAALDPDVVEAACCAHDLGHPPFGHVGEKAIDERTKERGDHEGYEGNAQTLRILTKLSLRSHAYTGLNPTRAVLAATVKYPWPHRGGIGKFGHFTPEKPQFDFSREIFTGVDENGQQYGMIDKSLEAAIMDHADDVAYSVHDLEDFHRIRTIPWRVLLDMPADITLEERERGYRAKFTEVVGAAFNSWGGEKPKELRGKLNAAAERVLNIVKEHPVLWREPYEGTALQRIELRRWTSTMIARYTQKDKGPSVEADKNGYAALTLPEDGKMEIHFLKQVTRMYVTQATVIGAQRFGHTRLVEDIYDDIWDDINRKRSKGLPYRILPMRYQHIVDNARADTSTARLTADAVSGLTELELVALHNRLHGTRGGSVSDPIVR